MVSCPFLRETRGLSVKYGYIYHTILYLIGIISRNYTIIFNIQSSPTQLYHVIYQLVNKFVFMDVTVVFLM